MAYLPMDHPEMAAAVASARATLPEFRRLLAAPAPGMAAFGIKAKFPSTDGGDEHCWVGDLTPSGDGFVGKLSVEPQKVEGFRLGSTVEVHESMITDWAYSLNGVYQGHFTTKVLLPYLPAKLRRRVSIAYGWQSPD
jgi:uncharacterized protein YegJ (DUF2314 family)